MFDQIKESATSSSAIFQRLTRTSAESTRQKVPDLPIPALQCMTGGPWVLLIRSAVDGITPDCLTAYKKERNASEFLGIPKSGHAT